MTAKVFYDGECPFCTRYVKMLRLRAAIGDIALVDLRSDAQLREELTNDGFDLDQGMVVEFEGRRLGGADATNALALMSTPYDLFNRLNRMIFAQPVLSAVLYPVLRSGRWFTLMLMGRKSIKETDHNVSWRQILFSFFFSFFSLFHVFNYAFAYDRFPPQVDLIAIFIAALVLIARPSSARALFVLMLASLISTMVQAPAQSNHTMLRTMVIIGYWLSFLYAFVRSRPVSDIFANFVLAGRGSLLVMYAFGIFHKINTDFLNPETSCAVRLWQDMPFPLSSLQGHVVDLMTIYGTYVAEGAIMLMLIYAPTRYLGMVLGIIFHLLLGLSDYAAYVAFTTLSISLHVLFLNEGQTHRVLKSPEMNEIRARMRRNIYRVVFFLLLTGGALAMYQRSFSLSNLYLLPFVLPLCFLIVKYGRGGSAAKSKPLQRPAYVIGLFVTALYFTNGISPYFGLKSAQAINMFANLRLEAGVSNHLVFSKPPGPFHYLEEVAVITDSGNDSFFRSYQIRNFGIVFYDLLGHLNDNPGVTVSFVMNDQVYSNVTSANFENEISTTLHNRWLRKWFHFLPVQLEQPEPCTL